jgi:imidazolonepropionase
MSDVAVVWDAAIAVDGGRFVWVGRREDWRGEARETVDAGGRAVVPGLVDPHTHAVWAGDRLGDFEARTSGKTYEEILAAGGGIRSTVKATERASVEELVGLAVPRIEALVRSGATVVEVKSGYGFSVEGEIRSLEAIRSLKLGEGLRPAHRERCMGHGSSLDPTSQDRDLGHQGPIPRILATLLVHIPPADATEREVYVDGVVGALIPEVARRGLATAVDIFVEREAFNVGEAERVLRCARAHGLGIKMHAEQFHAVGGVELALEMEALSVDHLEACSVSQCGRFAGKATVATILPGVSLHLGIPAAPGRGLIDSGMAGAAVAVGTDLNPGSSPLYSMAMAMGLAVRMNGLTANEALVAGTVNAAAALGIEDAGRIEVGLPADFLVLEERDWRSLVYTMGANPVREVWMGGVRAC